MSAKRNSESSETKPVPVKVAPTPKSWGEGNKTLRVAINNTKEK